MEYRPEPDKSHNQLTNNDLRCATPVPAMMIMIDAGSLRPSGIGTEKSIREKITDRDSFGSDHKQRQFGLSSNPRNLNSRLVPT
jgi:hypothetical protein